MLAKHVTVHRSMFKAGGMYKCGMAKAIDWGERTTRMTMPENILAQALVADAGRVANRGHHGLSKSLAVILNTGASVHMAAVLNVSEGSIPWPDPSANLRLLTKTLSGPRRLVLQHWACFDPTKHDIKIGVVSTADIEERMEEGAQYQPFCVPFAALILQHVALHTMLDVLDMLKPPKARMARAEIAPAVHQLFTRNHEGFCKPDEKMCAGKFHQAVQWDKMKPAEKKSAEDNKVLTPIAMAGFDMVMMACAWGQPVLGACQTAMVTPDAHFQARVAWWTRHWPKFPEVVRHMWANMTLVTDDDNSDSGGGQREEGSGSDKDDVGSPRSERVPAEDEEHLREAEAPSHVVQKKRKTKSKSSSGGGNGVSKQKLGKKKVLSSSSGEDDEPNSDTPSNASEPREGGKAAQALVSKGKNNAKNKAREGGSLAADG